MTAATNQPTYGFIGLGHQGTPMAQRMIDDGLRPWLWARRAEVLDRYRSADAHLAGSPADIGANCDVIGLCLYDAEATEAVLYGPDGIMSTVRPGTVLAMHATVGPGYVKDLAARVATHGVQLVDAPVSGADAALTRQLLVIVAGDADAAERCRPMFETYSQTIVPVGVVGAAQSAKVINNALFMAITGVVFDAFDVGESLGIDRAGLAEVLANGSAANLCVDTYRALGPEQYSIRAWPTLHKDLSLVQDVVQQNEVDTGDLVSAAVSAIRQMEHHRAAYVAERAKSS